MTNTAAAAESPSLARDLVAILKARPVTAAAAGQIAAFLAGAALGALAGPASPPAPAPVRAAARPRPVVSTLKPYVTAQVLAAPTESVDSRAMLQALMVKAGLRPRFELSQLTWAQAQKLNAVMPVARLPLDAAKPFHLAVDTKDGRQALHCLTQAAYYEAGASGVDAEAAVVQVVLNRVRHPNFPKSVCGVVYQGAARTSGCQFTFTCDGALTREVDLGAWKAAETVARRALGGYVVPLVGASTYYHANYVFPFWAPTLVKRATIGPHIFYGMVGEAGRASALTGRYVGGETRVSLSVLTAIDSLTQRGETAGPGRAALVDSLAPGSGARVHVQLAVAQAEPPALVVAELAAPAPLAPTLSTEAPAAVLAAIAGPARAEPPRRSSGHTPDPFH